MGGRERREGTNVIESTTHTHTHSYLISAFIESPGSIRNSLSIFKQGTNGWVELPSLQHQDHTIHA